eukprot:scaffold858_cov123-Cylindrotheca_fusiformis.AAC.7
MKKRSTANIATSTSSRMSGNNSSNSFGNGSASEEGSLPGLLLSPDLSLERKPLLRNRSGESHDGSLSSSASRPESSSCSPIIENLPLHVLPILKRSECGTQTTSSDDSLGSEVGRRRNGNAKIPSWTNNRTRVIFRAKKHKSTFSCSMLAFCVLGLAFYCSARSSLRSALMDTQELVEYSQKLGLQLRIAKKDVRLLERELVALDEMETVPPAKAKYSIASSSASSGSSNPQLIQEMATIQRSLRKSQLQAEHLKEQVKEISKLDAIARYGAGVQRVEIELIFLDSTNNEQDDGPTTFVIEMAPIDLMPHSVYTFLEMTSSGLLDGCSFILNAMHVLKAAPLPYDGSSPLQKAQEFLDKGLESVAFREYSPDYPHERYTVGFAADGSPSFYINTEDNSKIHVGDPCFAKIVSGLDTIRRMEHSPTRNGIWLEQRIGIRKATVL